MNTENTTLPAVEVTPQLTPLVSAQVVYEAARDLLACPGGVLGAGFIPAVQRLREAVARADAAIEASKPYLVDGPQHLEPPDDIDLEDITIHDECAVHVGECGVWYQAWVYVAKPVREG